MRSSTQTSWSEPAAFNARLLFALVSRPKSFLHRVISILGSVFVRPAGKKLWIAVFCVAPKQFEIAFNNVLFPEPFGPSMATTPFFGSKTMSSFSEKLLKCDNRMRLIILREFCTRCWLACKLPGRPSSRRMPNMMYLLNTALL